YTRIVASKPQDDVAVRPDEESVSSHRHCRHFHIAEVEGSVVVGTAEDISRVIISAAVVGSYNSLEIVAVQMERMLACVVVVDNKLNDLVVCKNKRIGVDAIDDAITGVVVSGKGCIEGRNLGPNVSDVVKE